MRIMNIKHGSCCDLVEQRVNFWFTNSDERICGGNTTKLFVTRIEHD